MNLQRLFFTGLSLMLVLTSCINIYHESPWEPVPTSVAATLTAIALTGTPAPRVTPTATIPSLPSPSPTFSGPPQDYEGSFTYGFEIIAFKPCNSDEVWWLNGDIPPLKELRTQYEALNKRMQPVHVKLRGLTSERGFYGHMGSYQREFYLQAVLDVRDIQADDCR